MPAGFKQRLRRRLPERVTRPVDAALRTLRLAAMRRRWNAAREAPVYLGRSDLEALQARYPRRTGYRYDQQSLRQRGQERARELLALPGAADARTFLEIACSDGMVSAALADAGKTAVAVDRKGESFDARARQSGVRAAAMDASTLAFADASFDYVFSYNSFEHFSDPERVLREMTRVLKPGGYTFHRFGPLYNSPWGEHAYRTVSVPYCQFLFSGELMNEFAAEHGLGLIDFDHVNRWSIEQYRALWQRFAGELEIVQYREGRDLSSVNILREFPQCFRGRVPSFENYLIGDITVLFRRK